MNFRSFALAFSLLIVSWPLLADQNQARKAMAEVQAANRDVDAVVVKGLIERGVLLLDVRSEEEWQAGRIRGAHHAHWFGVAGKAIEIAPDKDTPIVTYCAVGARAGLATARLRLAGYRHVIAMNQGGYAELVKEGMPSER